MGLLLIMVTLCGEKSPATWNAHLNEVRDSYSVEAADQLIAKLAEYNQSLGNSAIPEALSEAYLIKADLLRFEFEQLPKNAGSSRAVLGSDLDEAAKAGLVICEVLPESSEKYRRRADLRGTLIRSKFRAKKHRKKMKVDADRAVELDPQSARAYVSKAKLFLFADDRHGGDIERALDLLERAQKLDGSLENAQLLYAYALEEAGRPNEATQYYKTILERNSRCRPARTALENLSGSINTESTNRL